ncbi:hypothetical protein L596_005424 [Steinernema carpocapsae]|uniref:Uncharacterized protein n=1 Tax=Steinernema carpocapsae TaxID=34508 RepID=A0A4U8V0K0_STECR|nr:hypothetical protein L596_005424 [Steinernema carpocapsae]
MHARLPKMSPKCLYSAHIKGVVESSIVNLCDSHGGMFGTLALPNGTYVIEPVNSHDSKADKGQHLVFRFRSHNFHGSAAANSSSGPLDDLHLPPSPSRHDQNGNTRNESFYAPPDNADDEWVDITSRKTRARRSANSWDHYVEVLVVADYKMLVYHQGNLENYVLTLFSTQDRSGHLPSPHAIMIADLDAPSFLCLPEQRVEDLRILRHAAANTTTGL